MLWICPKCGVSSKDPENPHPCQDAAPAAGRWVPVGERLPERFRNVLTTDGTHYQMAAQGSDGRWLNSYNTPLEHITHWVEIRSPK
jgi:hypothetical protein